MEIYITLLVGLWIGFYLTSAWYTTRLEFVRKTVLDELKAAYAEAEIQAKQVQFLKKIIHIHNVGRVRVNQAPTSWRSALGFAEAAKPTRAQIDSQYRLFAKKHHPDMGGSVQAMATLNLAKQAAYKEVLS